MSLLSLLMPGFPASLPLPPYALCCLPLLQGYLVDGLRYEPHRRDGWYSLGRVHELQGRPDEAEQCLRTAVGLSLTAPVMSFGKLARLL